MNDVKKKYRNENQRTLTEEIAGLGIDTVALLGGGVGMVSFLEESWPSTEEFWAVGRRPEGERVRIGGGGVMPIMGGMEVGSGGGPEAAPPDSTDEGRGGFESGIGGFEEGRGGAVLDRAGGGGEVKVPARGGGGTPRLMPRPRAGGIEEGWSIEELRGDEYISASCSLYLFLLLLLFVWRLSISVECSIGDGNFRSVNLLRLNLLSGRGEMEKKRMATMNEILKQK